MTETSNDDTKRTQAELAYASGIKTNKLAFKNDEKGRELADAQLLGRNVLHEEIGILAGEARIYDFDAATRDRLLAHSRQDVAMQCGLLVPMHTQVHELKRQVKHLKRLVLLILVILVYLVLVD